MTERSKIAWSRIPAEAVAIIASILAAFAIDAWWAGRQEAALGSEYEARIATELRGNLNLLKLHLEYVERNLSAAAESAAFFDAGVLPVDGRQLVIDVYNMGRDISDQFDVSTYDDLVATGRVGLIRDAQRRQAIQKAYTRIRELGSILRPNRSEFLAGVRGWIPQSVIDKIRAACPSMRSSRGCPNPDIDVDPEVIDAIVGHWSSDSALLAYRLRVQGLFEKRGRTGEVIESVTEALATLE